MSRPDPEPTTTRLHASAVAFRKRAVLVLGPSGAGKSSLALQLMAYGADLVSDDQTCLTRRGDVLEASAPAQIRGRIEARGIGLLSAEAIEVAEVVLVVDLGQLEVHRLPPRRNTCLLGCTIPLVHRVESAHFPAAILQYLKVGRNA